MSNKRPPSFRSFQAQQRRERDEAPKPRVQYLRYGQSGLTSLKGTYVRPGRGAKHYVGAIQPLTMDAIRETMPTDVLVAVRRAGAAGDIVSATVRPMTNGTAREFLLAAEQGGATELHVHRLCGTIEEARAAAADLAPVAVQPLQVA